MSVMLDELILLLVEPSNTQQKILIEHLEQIGVGYIHSANSIESAIELAREVSPHAVLSALHLPDGTGASLLENIRDEPDLSSIAFLLISSETRTKELEPIRQGGAIAILPKPCSRDDLLGALRDTLDLLENDSVQLNNQDIEDIRTLVVDDSRAARMFITQVLKTLGIEHVEHAENGQAGIEALERGFYDLVVTDYNMPFVDGHQLVEYIRTRSCQPTIPVIMVTSQRSGARIAGVERVGVSAVCDKPFEINRVRTLLKTVLR